MEEKIQKNRLRFIISSIMGMFLTLFLTAFVLLPVAKYALFSENAIEKSIEKADYGNFVMESFMKNAEALTLSTGIPFEIFDNVISVEAVNKDVQRFIDSSIREESFEPDTKEWENTLENHILSFLDSEEYAITEEEEKSIQDYIASIREEYSKNIQIPLFTYYIIVKNHYDSIFPWVLFIIIAVMLGIIFFIFKINRESYKKVRYVSYSVLGSGIMIIILPAYCLVSELYRKVNVTPEYFYQFVMEFLKGVLQIFLYTGLAMIFLGVIIVFINETVRIKGNNRNTEVLDQ